LNGERSHRSAHRDEINAITIMLYYTHLFRPNYRRHGLLKRISNQLLISHRNGSRQNFKPQIKIKQG
jgi:hypothetical protein